MRSLYILFFIGLFLNPCWANWEEWTERFSPEIGVEFPVAFAVHGKVNLNQKIYFRLGLGFFK